MRRYLVVFLAGLLPVLGARARAEGQDSSKQPGPPVKMELLEVFPAQGNTYVAVKFYDAKEQPTRVTSGYFEYWSNFLKDKRQPASKRRLQLTDKDRVMEHNYKYTLKLPGVGRLCPPRVAKLRITFRSTSPKRRFTKTWKKRAQCHR